MLLRLPQTSFMCLMLQARFADSEDPELTDRWPEQCDLQLIAEPVFASGHLVSCTVGDYDMCVNYPNRERAGPDGMSVCECAKKCEDDSECLDDLEYVEDLRICLYVLDDFLWHWCHF